jgi:hypothetical protein
VPPPPFSLGSQFIVAGIVQDLRAFNVNTMATPAYAGTQGGALPNDGFGKLWWWNAASFAVDDGSAFTVVVRPTVIDVFSPGRWEQTSFG